MKTVEARSLDEWRRWLRKHHRTEPEVWLVFPKKQTGRPSVSYHDALDEALCFGWIDSLIKRLDAERFARKFTPRKPDSRWSDVNRKRYAELKAAGRLQPAGIKRPPTGRSYAPKPAVPAGLPDYIRDAIRKNPKAWSRFEALPPSKRRNFIVWIVLARQEATRARRLAEAIRLLAAGKELGLK